MSRSVFDFIQHVMSVTGISNPSVFSGRSEAHRDFLEHLKTLGWEKRTLEAEDTDNVYASAPLSDAEWDELEAEFYKLPMMG